MGNSSTYIVEEFFLLGGIVMAENLLAYGFANKFDAPNVAERLP
jgi:hypothetical protein